MNVKFWQKTYLLTLLLFLVCLNTGLFSLAHYTYKRNLDEAESTCRAEHAYLVRSFERDHDALGGASVSLLMRSYGTQFEDRQIRLAFTKDGETLFSNLPAEMIPAENNIVRMQRIDGVRYLILQSPVCETYLLTYAKDISELDDEYRSMMLTYSLVALGVSVLLALTLSAVLKKLSAPLERLRGTAEQITEGDLSVSADESGKDEVAQLAKSFNRMVGQLKTQMDELEQDAKRKQMLVDNMAHEMRTPLTSIRGYAEYIGNASLTEEETIDSARWILSEADRLKKISEKILDTAYIRNREIEKTPVELSALLADLTERLREKAAEKQVTLQTDTRACTVWGDETLLSMLFYNLTENAIKACSEGGHVTLCCEANTAVIRDDGKGMTEEQLQHITEPFYRTDKSRSRAEGGAGLGLALCAQIVRAHGAEMRFASEPGSGTQVFVNFSEDSHNLTTG